MEQQTNEYRANRLASMKALADLGFTPYGHKFPHTDLKDVRATFTEGAEVRVAGRLLMIRRMGKMNFATLNDGTDRFQVIFKRDELSEKMFAGFKHLNLGDIIGIRGVLFTTQKGEKSVVVKEWDLLAKALEQPPEKFHGLADQEECYRRRYVDLMVNDESRARFFTRSRLLMEIRKYLWGKGFVEVETPILQDQAGGAAAKPFFSHFNALDQDGINLVMSHVNSMHKPSLGDRTPYDVFIEKHGDSGRKLLEALGIRKVPGNQVTLHPFLLGQKFQRHADKVTLRKNGVTNGKKPGPDTNGAGSDK